MELPAKLRALRLEEGLTQSEFSDLLGLSYSTYKKHELALRAEMSSAVLLKITNHPRFKKYALWLVTGETCGECGQISPV
ncbi:helix-turn-helix transcriptional regulator [Pseudomonas sp. SIMBA_041]|uniref:helix-turn-helix domain-containing protein n=1 Tax=Pseudomonas sp. SIMBA_041 TaxID=3085782 RepID=UPI00397A1E5C